MSWRFHAYRFRRRDLWSVQTTLQSYLAAADLYSIGAMEAAIVYGRRVRRLGMEAHTDWCKTRYLGACDCDLFDIKKLVSEWVTKDSQGDGYHGQVVQYGTDYLMRITGVHYWAELFPEALHEHLGLREVWYCDGGDVPPEERPNIKLAEHFEREREAGRYFMLPLLTVDDVDKLFWQVTIHLARAYTREAE